MNKLQLPKINYPQLAKLRVNPLTQANYANYPFVLQITSAKANAPFAALVSKRRKLDVDNKTEHTVVSATNGNVVVNLNLAKPATFKLHEQIRLGLKASSYRGGPLAVDLRLGNNSAKLASEIIYATLVAIAAKPSLAAKPKPSKDCVVDFYGVTNSFLNEVAVARAQANQMSSWLSALPGNVLNPDSFLQFASKTALEHGLTQKTWTVPELDQLGAGAFTAVTGKNGPGGIIKISYIPKTKSTRQKTIALVGKGVCFDTGGVNIKPHRGMLQMHADMAGAAAVLAAITTAAKLKLKIRLDAWLAIADNRVFREAYAPADVIQAADGTRIEIVHSDAEGRMVLADTLHFAAKTKPAIIVSFATLTGSMLAALGNRISGILGNNSELLDEAIATSNNCGERLHQLPLAEDYATDLDSTIADVKQCAVNGDADHTLAALLLQKFIGKSHWLHLDLSASYREDGLGATTGPHTGFGANWAIAWLIAQQRK